MNRRDFLRRCSATALVCGAAAGAGALARLAEGAARGAAGGAVGGAAADARRWTRTACDLCGLADPVFLETTGGAITAVKGIPASTTGFGRLCARARALVTAGSEHRLLRPMVRRDPATKGTLEGLEPASWDEALGMVRARGAQRYAFLAGDGETNESYHLLSRVARQAFRTDHLATIADLDAVPAWDACLESFGIPANPASIADIDAASLLVVVGGEIADSHPALYYRMLDARRAGRARLVLIDARKTEAAALADLHVRPLPGHELAAWSAMAAAVMGRGADPAGAAALWRGAGRVVTLVGPAALSGPSGGELARAVTSLHVKTGQAGAIGKGCLFLPRGANTGGVALFGISPGRLPGARFLDRAQDRAAIARLWDAAPGDLPSAPGAPLLDWPDVMASGGIDALVVIRANPAAELPGARQWRDALKDGFVVCATPHAPTETTVLADVLLPLALVAGESAGTLMNVDRRCRLVDAATPPPGEARTASDLVLALAKMQLDGAALDRDFGRYAEGPHVAWNEWTAFTAGGPFDMTGITVERLRGALDLKWPCRAADDPGTERLGVPATAPPPVPRPSASGSPARASSRSHESRGTRGEAAGARGGAPGGAPAHPLLLIGGPVREHFRSRVVTGLCPELHYEAPVARIEMNPVDGAALEIQDGEWVTLASDTGELTARVWLTERSPAGVLFIPEHYGFLSDTQGGTDGLKEPEGLLHLVTRAIDVPGAGPRPETVVAVTARKSRRRDLRKRGLRRVEDATEGEPAPRDSSGSG